MKNTEIKMYKTVNNPFSEEKCFFRIKGETEIVLFHNDCRDILPNIPDNSIHLVLTDPPYFLDGLDETWRKGNPNSVRGTGSVGGLPVGMKFDPNQGLRLERFISTIFKEIVRILVPGGFLISFSQPRLYHRIAVAAENTGMHIRDMFAWRFTKKAQFKAFTLSHFVRKLKISDTEKEKILRELANRRTPQLRPQFEALMLAQKPLEGKFIDNWLKWKAGLIDTSKGLDNGVPSTVMTVEKPVKESYNNHLSVKPVELLIHLIEIFTLPSQTILDPFLGSGSTAVAALRTKRNCIGIDKNSDFLKIAIQRLRSLQHEYNSS